jgi:DNA-binding Lrp family transcriptional regulator
VTPDNIDRMVLYYLGKNGRISSSDIAEKLHNIGLSITDRAVRQRLIRLEKSGIILGYSAILNPRFISENSKVSKTVLMKFRFSARLQELTEKLENLLQDSNFCVYSARLSGDFDWICHFIFDSVDQFELENSSLLQRFAELIIDYRVYDSKAIKIHPYSVYDEHELSEMKRRINQVLNSLNKHDDLRDRLQATVESLVKHFNASFARLWIVDKERKNLLLRFSAGKYKNIDGEFSKVSINSVKIGQIAKRKKPIITNDVANDPRIKHPDWARREKLQSFAGYPILHKGGVIGVLAMFSEKKLSSGEFEMLGVFCDHISKQLSMLFSAQEFLLINEQTLQPNRRNSK